MEEWAIAHGTSCRIAAHLLRHDDRQLEEILRAAHESGDLPEIVEQLMDTLTHICAVEQMLRAVLTRTSLVLERID
jgi:predicted alpha/beta hydrolase family esterase